MTTKDYGEGIVRNLYEYFEPELKVSEVPIRTDTACGVLHSDRKPGPYIGDHIIHDDV